MSDGRCESFFRSGERDRVLRTDHLGRPEAEVEVTRGGDVSQSVRPGKGRNLTEPDEGGVSDT